MIKRLLFILIIGIAVQNCSSSKARVNGSSTSKLPVKKERITNKQSQSIIKSAKKYKGVRYKYGGDSKRGMDCSGLIYVSFQDNDIKIPRTTSQLKSYGNWIDLKDVKAGDLVFFATKKNSRNVNHVGIVTEVNNGNLNFIHASTSKGVVISSLSERYWYFAFVQARRVL